jgi:hypothetical protein
MTNYIIKREGEKRQLLPVTLEVEETLRKRKHKRLIKPDRSLKVVNHSPTGFEFGYGGSGPAQLALAILLDYLNNKELAVELHQQFKWKKIATMDHPGGMITGQEIDEFIKKERSTDR